MVRRGIVHDLVLGLLHGMDALRSSRCRCLSVQLVRHRFINVAADRVDHAILSLVDDIYKEIRCGRVLSVIASEDIILILNLCHILVVVLAPHILAEVADVDVVVAE